MKLMSSPASPFGRKVTMTIAIKNLGGQMQPMPVDATKGDTGLNAANPLGRIPALVLDNGDTIHDSHVICEYLDSIGSGPILVPRAGPERWDQKKTSRGRLSPDKSLSFRYAACTE